MSNLFVTGTRHPPNSVQENVESLDLRVPILIVVRLCFFERDIAMSVQAVSDKDFEKEVVEAQGPVLVDFWAEWCGPCKNLMPIVEEVANEMGNKIKVVKVNIDESPEAPTKYGVRGIPTLMVFKGGKVIDTRVGGMPKSQLSEWLAGKV
jgi:thioredoxin 1